MPMKHNIARARASYVQGHLLSYPSLHKHDQGPACRLVPKPTGPHLLPSPQRAGYSDNLATALIID